MNRLSKAIVVSLSLLVFGYVSLGYLLGKTDDDKTYRSLTVYGEVLQHIQEDYVDEPDLSAVTAGSLHGLLESLDPYSAYLSPREYSDYKEKQKNPPRGEVGVTVAKRFGYAMVVSVLPDSPAEKAGVRAGDILEAIAGFTTRDMSVPQADALLDGAPGTTVKAAVVRRGLTEPQDMELSRAVLTMPHISVDKIDDVAYARVPALGAGSAAELRDKLTAVRQARPSQAGPRSSRLRHRPSLRGSFRGAAFRSFGNHLGAQRADHFAQDVRRRAGQGRLAHTGRSAHLGRHLGRCGSPRGGPRR